MEGGQDRAFNNLFGRRSIPCAERASNVLQQQIRRRTHPMAPLTLKPVERIEVTTLMDNYIDLLLESTPKVRRPSHDDGHTLFTRSFLAEHGLSLLIRTMCQGDRHSIMLDTGYNSHSVMHNIELLEIDISPIEALVISHAHMDHAGGLYPLIAKMTKPVSVVAHPDIFAPERIRTTGGGGQLRFPQCYDRERLSAAGVELVESRQPIAIAGNTIGVTGEVERTTDFEKGMPNALIRQNDQWVPDPIRDDQSLVVHLQGKGLVLITGCCHAGIINTLSYAIKITGIQEVHAVLGGLHLSAAAFSPLMEETIVALAQINPQILIPMHCTGWQSTHQLAEAFPDNFILNSVGSTYLLE
jgi:7,8-dihydropterin-6-yl-methyl-4-(beta-D-ribofuranosyl)aminobenzene 5'-phosphate synthase